MMKLSAVSQVLFQGRRDEQIWRRRNGGRFKRDYKYAPRGRDHHRRVCHNSSLVEGEENGSERCHHIDKGYDCQEGQEDEGLLGEDRTAKIISLVRRAMLGRRRFPAIFPRQNVHWSW